MRQACCASGPVGGESGLRAHVSPVGVSMERWPPQPCPGRPANSNPHGHATPLADASPGAVAARDHLRDASPTAIRTATRHPWQMPALERSRLATIFGTRRQHAIRTATRHPRQMPALERSRLATIFGTRRQHAAVFAGPSAHGSDRARRSRRAAPWSRGRDRAKGFASRELSFLARGSGHKLR